MKGAVLAMLADTQAAHAIGGFKVGVGFSLRKCRNCLATKETMSAWVSTSCVIACFIRIHLSNQFVWNKAMANSFERDKHLPNTCVA